MATIQHPTIPTVRLEVSEYQVDEWLEQGWLRAAAPEPFDAEGEFPNGAAEEHNATGEPERVTKPQRGRR